MTNKQTLDTLEHIVQMAKSTAAKIPARYRNMGQSYGIMGASYGMGLGLGALGNHVGDNWKIGVPAIPPTMDLFSGGGLSLKAYVPYALGVATNYFGPIYEVSKEILRNNLG